MVRISDRSQQLNPAALKPNALNNKKNKNPVAQVSDVLKVREIEQIQATKKIPGIVTNLTKNFGRRSVIAIATVVALAILVPIAMTSVQPKPEPQFDYKQADKFFNDILKQTEQNKEKPYESAAYFPKSDELQDDGTIDLDFFDYSKAVKFFDVIQNTRLPKLEEIYVNIFSPLIKNEQNEKKFSENIVYYPKDNRLINEELQDKDLRDKEEYLQQEIPSEEELQGNKTQTYEIVELISSEEELQVNKLQTGEIVELHNLADSSYLETSPYFRMDTISYNPPNAISMYTYTDSSKQMVVKFLEDKAGKSFSNTTKSADNKMRTAVLDYMLKFK